MTTERRLISYYRGSGQTKQIWFGGYFGRDVISCIRENIKTKAKISSDCSNDKSTRARDYFFLRLFFFASFPKLETVLEYLLTHLQNLKPLTQPNLVLEEYINPSRSQEGGGGLAPKNMNYFKCPLDNRIIFFNYPNNV